MRLSYPSGVRARLLTLVLLALAPVVVLLVFSHLEQRRDGTALARENALRLARVSAANEARLIEGARQLLIALSHSREVSGGDRAACEAFFARLRTLYEGYVNFGVVNAAGDWTCSGTPLERPISLADRAYFQRAIESRGFAVGNYQLGRVTGRATLNVAYPWLDERGAPQGVVFAALDLQWLGRVAAEAKLPSGATLTVLDRNGTILARDPDPERYVGQAAAGTALVQRILGGAEGTTEVTGLDGVPCIYGFAPVRRDGQPASGEPVHTVILRDISARRRAEEERDRYFEMSLDLLSVAGFDGYFKRVNASWQKTLGWTREDLLAGPYLDLVHPDDVERTIHEASRLTSGEVTITFENRYRCKDGSYRWIEWTAVPDLERQVIYASSRDVTERKRAEEQIQALNSALAARMAELSALNQELEAFSYSVSHDLRAPLRHVTGFAELLRRKLPASLDDTGRRYVTTIVDAAARMGRLIDDLLAFSRMGRVEILRTSVDLERTIDEVRQELTGECAGREIAWTVHPLPRVQGDPSMLRLVMQNLLSNAIKLDLKMPKMDGLEVLRRIRADQHLKTVPVVMLTSSREESDLIASYELGTNGYVVKPVEFADFMNAVKEIGVYWAVINEPPPGSVRRTA